MSWVIRPPRPLLWCGISPEVQRSGNIGFVVCWFVVFLALYAAVSALGNPTTTMIDRLATAVITAARHRWVPPC